jgi:hypothetical protein
MLLRFSTPSIALQLKTPTSELSLGTMNLLRCRTAIMKTRVLPPMNINIFQRIMVYQTLKASRIKMEKNARSPLKNSQLMIKIFCNRILVRDI